MGMGDRRHALRLPVGSRPAEPAVLLLVEDAERLIAQLGELRAPAGAAAHRAIVLDDTDDVNLLAAVHLVPQRLEDLAQRRTVGVAAMHQPRDVLEADVAGLQLLVIEHANAAAARLGVTFEGEVHFFDAVALGAAAELRLGAGRRAAEQDVVGLVHDQLSSLPAVALAKAGCQLPVLFVRRFAAVIYLERALGALFFAAAGF